MSAEGTKDSLQGIEDVARAYEAAGFDEQPPAHVDRAVLAAARQRRRPRLASFVPAFALAATVLLSFSLVLRSGMLGIGGVDAPIAQDPLPATVPPSEIQAEEAFLRDDEALDAVAPAGDFADAPAEGLRRERTSGEPSPAATPSPPPQADADGGSGVGTTFSVEAQAVREPQATQALEAELEEAVSLRSVAAPEAAAQDCQATSGGDPMAWLQCISQRLETGAEEIARSELEAFVEANPDVQLPADLQALRGP